MIRKCLLLTLLCGGHLLMADDDDDDDDGQTNVSQAWVRQTVLDSGLIYDIPLDATKATNSFSAGLEIGEQGSLFQLFATGTAWDSTIYLLDSKLLRTYAPAASVEVETEDPYVRGDASGLNQIRRTRADRPFSVNITVSGLVPGGDDDAERYVYFACNGINYDTTSYSGLNQSSYLIQESNLENGVHNIGPVYHELTSTSPSLGCGEQSYKIIRYASDGVPATILAEPKVEIWPVATATVENVEAGKLYIDRLPTLILNLSHLYPDSRTYAQIYKGAAVLGTTGTVISGTELRYGRHYNPDLAEEPTNVPQTQKISITDLSNYAYRDGTYTLEIITETPFFGRTAERLFHVTFQVDRIISARGQISSDEKPSAPSP
jgi:hypothetical protein